MVRADSAGAVGSLIEGLVARNVEVSVYARVNAQLSAAIAAVDPGAWAKAIRDDGGPRHAGEVAELDVALAGWPAGTGPSADGRSRIPVPSCACGTPTATATK